ncbi:septal ring lytic transglycosylase RlpA family protein [Echinicola strongylocentroti]|uniref:Probable endolytic peptidoglycan transglycosylase RlpA n=1 Tax=Echinicola strongylocentroti TaxID=1795355 RepID=A0A2Z4IHX6_9BACT|nr:septal ring lytic transglycosylase RlpA family protein [Echinicola strongylocentroti]AWW30108.1 septal ring lytic transglycosylase RlpA family protein [Echinicola strongylocentroti]
MKKQVLLWSILLFLFSSCVATRPSSNRVEKGQASYYANKFNGRKTASGERYQPGKMTAAHRSLPFGTVVKVKNLRNGKTVKVRINDRGPFVRGRIIDLSKKAARQLDMIRAGVVPVEVRY